MNYIKGPKGEAVEKSAWHELLEVSASGPVRALLVMGRAFFERVRRRVPEWKDEATEIYGRPYVVSDEVNSEACFVCWGNLAEMVGKAK